jgi:hypothetical protein
MSATEPCVVCKKSFYSNELLYGSKGMICVECEANARMDSNFTRGLWMTVIGGPMFGMTGTSMLCAILLFGPVGPFFGFCFGVATFLAGWRALMAGWTLSQPDAEQQVGGLEKGALFTSGALSLAWGLGLTGFSALSMLAFLFA